MSDVMIAEYNASMREAVRAYLQGDESVLRTHCDNYGIEWKENKLVRDCMVRKVITGHVGFTQAERQAAKDWLTEHGLHSWDDGELQ